MADKGPSKANLTALGAEVLAVLRLEAVNGDAARQRRVRMTLAARMSCAKLSGRGSKCGAVRMRCVTT